MLREFLGKFKRLIYYFVFSCMSSVLDFAVTTTLFKLFFVYYITANTIGIISGFIFHFIISSKTVFNVKPDIKSFVTYLITFVIGLAMANTVLFISYETLGLNFVTSKFLSMGIPFFAIYYMRSAAYRFIEGFKHDEQGV